MIDSAQSLIIELLAIVGVFLVALLLGKWVERNYDHGQPPTEVIGRGFYPLMAIFALGAAVSAGNLLIEIAQSKSHSHADSNTLLENLIISGAVWAIAYEIINRIGQLRRRTLPLHVAIVWLFQRPVWAGVNLLVLLAKGQPTDSFLYYRSSLLAWLPALGPWSWGLNVGPSVPIEAIALIVSMDLIQVSLLVGATYFLLYRPFSSEHRIRGAWSGYGGIEMTPAKSHTTRFLCASAFLVGAQYRHRILEYLEDANRAVAPEPGVDLGLVAQVCRFAEREATKYYLLFILVWLATSIVSGLINQTLGVVVLVLGSGLLYFFKELRARKRCMTLFARDSFDPDKVRNQLPTELDSRIHGALPTEDQNLVVYGSFSPFVGAGISLGGWSFAINIDKPKDDILKKSRPERFETSELYSEVDKAIRATGLEGLSVTDMFFVHGSDIRKDKDLLPSEFGRPLQRLDTERANPYINGSDSRIRHYKWIRVHDWGNELVTSYFLRCALRGNNMFVEINRYLLTPLDKNYRKIDAMPNNGWRRTLLLALVSLLIGPLYMLYSFLALLAKVLQGVRKLFGAEERRRRREIKDNPLFNYGSPEALRESVSSSQFVHYFQKLDGDFYAKMLEREILDAIVTFLDDHNIDTFELKERQSTILNSGIIVQGGDVKAESLAVGAGASASKTEGSAAKLGKRIKKSLAEGVA